MEDVDWLANLILYYMGSYVDHIRQPGEWVLHPGKPARVKRKGGKVKKIYSIAQAGWQEYHVGN